MAALRGARETRDITRSFGEAAYGFMRKKEELQRQRWEAIAEAARAEATNGTAPKEFYTPTVRGGNSDEVLGVPQPKDGAVVYPGIAVTPEMEKFRQPFFAQLRGTKTNETVKGSPPEPMALGAFLTNACGISRALAADDLGQFNQQVTQLSARLASLQKELAGSPPWDAAKPRVETFIGGAAAKDLAQARTRFLPFSTALVELTRSFRKANPALDRLKIYHCPMAPKPGLWVQTSGPLRNPFYGAKMLTCGEEVSK